jgi:hypothetical protein
MKNRELPSPAQPPLPCRPEDSPVLLTKIKRRGNPSIPMPPTNVRLGVEFTEGEIIEGEYIDDGSAEGGDEIDFDVTEDSSEERRSAQTVEARKPSDGDFEVDIEVESPAQEDLAIPSPEADKGKGGPVAIQKMGRAKTQVLFRESPSGKPENGGVGRAKTQVLFRESQLGQPENGKGRDPKETQILFRENQPTETPRRGVSDEEQKLRKAVDNLKLKKAKNELVNLVRVELSGTIEDKHIKPLEDGSLLAMVNVKVDIGWLASKLILSTDPAKNEGGTGPERRATIHPKLKDGLYLVLKARGAELMILGGWKYAEKVDEDRVKVDFDAIKYAEEFKEHSEVIEGFCKILEEMRKKRNKSKSEKQDGNK